MRAPRALLTMSTTTQFWATLGSLAALLALQTFWIAHALRAVGERIDDLRSDMDARFDGVNARLDGLDERVRGLERERS